MKAKNVVTQFFEESSFLSFSLYLHWPYCVSKCPYCDFNSFVGQSESTDIWERAYIKALQQLQQTHPHYTHVRSIFWGGGTPSLMDPAMVERVLAYVRTLWQVPSDVEITLETNPQSFEIAKFHDMAQAGINRVSIGVQSFNPATLAFLKRAHSSDEAKQAVEGAIALFPRVSIDLIAAIPGFTLEDWQKDLLTGLSYKVTHMSCYQLTIEPGTAFATQVERGDWQLPDEATAIAIDTLTRRTCAEHGLLDYEVSNFARPGFESQHNLAYWRYQDYAGIGPGAHGRLHRDGQTWATVQPKTPHAWLQAVLEHGSASAATLLSAAEVADERMLMGLRLTEGALLSGIRYREERVKQAADEGWVEVTSTHIRLTPQGRLRLNALLSWLSH